MITLDVIRKSDNLTGQLSKSELADIAQQVVKGYDIDVTSRDHWQKIIDKVLPIAQQLMSEKNTPWPNASNVKFPLITMACVDYASRTLPELIPNGDIVKLNVNGADPKGDKLDRSKRVAKFTSYQLLVDSPDWQEDTDKLLQVLAVFGTVFKKTYYNKASKKVVSELCTPDKIIVNYNVKSLEAARRITHIIELSQNDIITRQRKGLFNKDIDIELLRATSDSVADNDFLTNPLEQQCWLDLDEDGYKEPYIATVHKDSLQVLRLVSNFKEVHKNSKGQVVEITQVDYFTDYHFIRALDGGFYSMGFGSLLLSTNSAVNTLFNLLVDSGKLNNLQGGFLGKGIRIKNGEFKVKMGEWKQLDTATGATMAQNVFAIPTKEPSQVLYQLLGMLIQIGKDLSSTTDVLKGKQPAQNVATGTINTLVEQGTMVFKAINKRVYRSQAKDYKKILELDYEYLTDAEYQNVLDDPNAIVKVDFNPKDCAISPIADPSLSSLTARLTRAQLITQMPEVDKEAAARYFLNSMQLDKSDVDLLLPKKDPNAPPPPEVQEIMANIQLVNAQVGEISAKMTLAAERNQMDMAKMQQDIKESDARMQYQMALVWQIQKNALHNDQKVQTTNAKMQSEQIIKATVAGHKQSMDEANLILTTKELELQAQDILGNQEIEAAKVVSNHHTKMASVNKPKEEKESSKKKSAPKYNQEDIIHTARLKGLSIDQVKQQLGVSDAN